MDKKEWCPARNGTYRAFLPEYYCTETNRWKNIPLASGKTGVPQPVYDAGINMALDLCGYEQAQALAWKYSAQAIAEGKHIDIRVQEYEVVYDIKARKAHSDHAKQDNR